MERSTLPSIDGDFGKLPVEIQVMCIEFFGDSAEGDAATTNFRRCSSYFESLVQDKKDINYWQRVFTKNYIEAIEDNPDAYTPEERIRFVTNFAPKLRYRDPKEDVPMLLIGDTVTEEQFLAFDSYMAKNKAKYGIEGYRAHADILPQLKAVVAIKVSDLDDQGDIESIEWDKVLPPHITKVDFSRDFLDGGGVTDLSQLRFPDTVEEMSFEACSIESLKGKWWPKGLKKLKASHSGISDVSDMFEDLEEDEIPALEQLLLDHTELSEFVGELDLSALVELDLSGTGITSLGEDVEVPKLKTVTYGSE